MQSTKTLISITTQLKLLCAVLILATLATTETNAQTLPSPPNKLELGTVSGINLDLIFPTTVNGKTYYYLDHNESGDASTSGDFVTHAALNSLLNSGNDTADTLPEGHDGRDDQRSVIIDDYVLILPTLTELIALRSNLGNRAPSNWRPVDYWTSTPISAGNFNAYNLGNGADSTVNQHSPLHTAFQVRPVSAIILNPESMMVFEGVTDSTYTVVLNAQPTTDVTVTITSDNLDVTTNPTSLTFTTLNWNSLQTVTVMVAEDTDLVQDTAILTHTASGGNYDSAIVTLIYTITDTTAMLFRIKVFLEGAQ